MTQSGRPRLHVVESHVEQVSWAWFCGHCGAPAPADHVPAPTARICRGCEMGVMLETVSSAAPAAGDPFLIVDGRLLVQAVSRGAERFLTVREEDAVNRPVAEMLAAADAEAATGRFAAAIHEIVAQGAEPITAFVRPANTFGVRLRARIVACGPPRAALVVLETPGGRRLRSV